VSRHLREGIADWLMLLGALLLAVSLFFVWSHQFSPAFAAEWGTAGPLRGVPRDPTGWQVYSIADVCLLVVAAMLVLVSFVGTRRARLIALVPAGLALAFVVHAMSVPPTNGVDVATAAGGVAAVASQATSATGETLALIGLAIAIAGLGLSFTAD
jgi:hypothetical protein